MRISWICLQHLSEYPETSRIRAVLFKKPPWDKNESRADSEPSATRTVQLDSSRVSLVGAGRLPFRQPLYSELSHKWRGPLALGEGQGTSVSE